MTNSDLVVAATESDNPSALDIAMFCQQTVDVSDIISLKTYANTEFCPRFISDENDYDRIGSKLDGKTVVIVSTSSTRLTRNELAMRTMLVARAAKDNGAQRVLLVEPDLFYSAQDRGARPDQGRVDFVRDARDYKKFDGQPFTSRFYAEALKLAGVDTVITVHNHSVSVQRLFEELMPGGFYNLSPVEIFAHYIQHSDVAPALHNGQGLLVCAPDKGARDQARCLQRRLGLADDRLLVIAKQRLGERSVESFIDPESCCPVEGIAGHDVIVFDDMVRTGTTIRVCGRMLKEAGARRVVFFVTHFYASQEGREGLSGDEIDEIITTNTLPSILNRDSQGRLRRKMTVLKLERWISLNVLRALDRPTDHVPFPYYRVDMSAKNPRWTPGQEPATI